MIKPLLEITTTPAKYEYEISRAKLQISQKQVQVERTTQRASLNMRKEFGRFEMNSTRRRSDMGFKGVVERAVYEGDRGVKMAMEATANYVDLGNQIVNAHKGATIPDALWSQSMKHRFGDLVLVPLSSVDINYVPASLAMDFVPPKMNANWDLGKARLDFVPGSFEMRFTQYSSISIKYLGGPHYVPPSADPDFKAEA